MSNQYDLDENLPVDPFNVSMERMAAMPLPDDTDSAGITAAEHHRTNVTTNDSFNHIFNQVDEGGHDPLPVVDESDDLPRDYPHTGGEVLTHIEQVVRTSNEEITENALDNIDNTFFHLPEELDVDVQESFEQVMALSSLYDEMTRLGGVGRDIVYQVESISPGTINLPIGRFTTHITPTNLDVSQERLGARIVEILSNILGAITSGLGAGVKFIGQRLMGNPENPDPAKLTEFRNQLRDKATRIDSGYSASAVVKILGNSRAAIETRSAKEFVLRSLNDELAKSVSARFTYGQRMIGQGNEYCRHIELIRNVIESELTEIARDIGSLTATPVESWVLTNAKDIKQTLQPIMSFLNINATGDSVAANIANYRKELSARFEKPTQPGMLKDFITASNYAYPFAKYSEELGKLADRAKTAESAVDKLKDKVSKLDKAGDFVVKTSIVNDVHERVMLVNHLLSIYSNHHARYVAYYTRLYAILNKVDRQLNQVLMGSKISG